MGAQFYVHRAKADATVLRNRLAKYGFQWDLGAAIDIQTLAECYLGCEVILLRGLSDFSALKYLHSKYDIDISAEEPDDRPLAGAFYMTLTGLHRWLFVEMDDSPLRRRFSIAHEVAHLVLEAEPAVQRLFSLNDPFIDGKEAQTILRFGRCSDASVTMTEEPAKDQYASVPLRSASFSERGVDRQKEALGPKIWQEVQLREIAANHFAAELLLPYEGIRRVIAAAGSTVGIKSIADLEETARCLAVTYQVSKEAAQKRLTKDLAIVPASDRSIPDLFE